MTYIAARPTTYRGIAMRSRLEALVAAELDRSVPGQWQYEPRAFANEHGQYLPDFQLTGHPHPFYIEVKPTLDLALRATERMQVIWDSEADAILLVFAAVEGDRGIGIIAYGDGDRRWRRA